jgi:hypothetical protein
MSLLGWILFNGATLTFLTLQRLILASKRNLNNSWFALKSVLFIYGGIHTLVLFYFLLLLLLFLFIVYKVAVVFLIVLNLIDQVFYIFAIDMVDVLEGIVASSVFG